MSLDEAGKNIIDFLKIILKILLIGIFAQLVLDLTKSNLEIPLIHTILQFLSGIFKGAITPTQYNI